jgi:hypothetical protein
MKELSYILKFLSGEAVSEYLGMEIVTIESLASGMYQPQSQVAREIKQLYREVSKEYYKSIGLTALESNRLQYQEPEILQSYIDRETKLIAQLAYKYEVDPNIIKYQLEQSDKSLEEKELSGENVSVPKSFFEQIKNEILYI